MTESGAAPFLAPVLRAGLPAGARLDLLRACLLPDSAAREAFKRWHASSPDPRRALAGSVSDGRLLAALLLRTAERGQWDMDAALRTHLRVAVENERRRAVAFRDILLEVCRIFRRAEVRFLALKGADVAFSAYPDPSLRHSHDIDLLFPLDQLGRAADALRDAGFTKPDASQPLLGVHRTWTHSSGLPAQLHRWPFLVLGYGEALDDAWSRSTEVVVEGEPVRVLSREDALVHSVVHASAGPHRSSMVWAPDAYFLVDKVRDWSVVEALAGRGGFALPVAVGLRFLKIELGAPVPEDLLNRLDRAANRVSRIHRETALHGLLPGRLTVWRSATTGAERRFIARWTFLPSLDYVAWRSGRSGPSLILAYILRPLAVLWRRLMRS